MLVGFSVKIKSNKQDSMILYGIFAAVLVAMVAFQFLSDTWDFKPAKAHSTATMAAVVYREHGDPSVLRFETTFPRPVPRSNQYLIEVKASALNPVDFKMMRSRSVPQFLLPLPKVPGADLAGVIIEVPEGSSNKFKVGDRVAAMMPILSKWGSNADYAVVDERFLAKMGDNTDFDTAAAVPLAALTVYHKFQSLQQKDSENKGKKLLVHAGAGGVGSFAIQWGKLLGMYVATTASAQKADILKELGADLVIDYKAQNFQDVCQDYDVVLDPMSWLYEEASLSVLKPTGHYLNVPSSDWGLQNGKEITNGFLTFKNYVTSKVYNLLRPGSTPKYSLNSVSPNGEALQVIMDLLDKGTLRALVDRKFHLSDASEAYHYLEAGHATGKVVIQHGPKQSQE